MKMSSTLSRSLLLSCMLFCSLLSVSAFFALNSPKLVIERLDPLVNPGGYASHLHTILGGSNWSDRYDYNTSIQSDCTTMPVSVDKSNYWSEGNKQTHTCEERHVHANRRHASPVVCSNPPTARVHSLSFPFFFFFCASRTPTLYYVHPDQQSFEVVPLGFGRIYYLSRPGPTQHNKIVAFPPGFRVSAL